MSAPVAEPADDRVRFTVASDPMMGLAWECEPVLRRLETHFEGRIEIRHAMSVLVRDIADFVDPEPEAASGRARPWRGRSRRSRPGRPFRR